MNEYLKYDEFLTWLKQEWQNSTTEEQQEALYNEHFDIEFNLHQVSIPFDMVSYWAMVDTLESIPDNTEADTWFIVSFKHKYTFVPRIFDILDIFVNGLMSIIENQ